MSNQKKRKTDISIQSVYNVAADNVFAQQRYITNSTKSSKGSKGASPTLTEEKAIAYVLSKLKPTDSSLQPISIEIKDFCSICGFNERYYYSHTRTILLSLGSRAIYLWENGSEHARPYFIDIAWTPGCSVLTFTINPLLEPYLIQLNGNFFQFTLRNILAMKTDSGIRLYKLLKSLYFKYNDTVPAPIAISVDSLREYLDCVDKYALFADFRKRILEPALRDINEFSDLEVEMETVKSGKSITTIVFHTTDLVKENMPADQAEAKRRSRNVDKKIDPDQFFIDEIFDGIGDYPL